MVCTCISYVCLNKVSKQSMSDKLGTVIQYDWTDGENDQPGGINSKEFHIRRHYYAFIQILISIGLPAVVTSSFIQDL